MRDHRQHSELLYEHWNKPKIEFDHLQNFANTKESIENQKSTKNKPGSVNQIKGKGKSSAKQPTKSSSSKDTKSETKWGKCGVKWHETENCNSNYWQICKQFFHKTELCYFNKDRKNYKPNFKPKTDEKKDKPATVNSIQRGRNPTLSSCVQQTPSFLKFLPPSSPHRISWGQSKPCLSS